VSTRSSASSSTRRRFIELETIHAKRDMAAASATISRRRFTNAKFNIVGGDGAFFDRFVKAVSVGQSIDGVMDSSDNVRNMVQSRCALMTRPSSVSSRSSS